MRTEFNPNTNGMIRPVPSFILSVVLFFLAGNGPLFAQQGAPQDNLLPEIDPQDIEIRSEFTARFPGLRRQPILGFSQSPGVYQISPDRQPFMETQEEVVASLPITDLSRPTPPPYDSLQYRPQSNGYGRLGIGSFFSPEAEFWGYSSVTGRSSVAGSFEYRSSSGHLDAENSSYRFLNADAEYRTDVSDRTELTFNGGLQSDFNRLYELENRQTLPITVPEGPRKSYMGYNAGISFENSKNAYEGWNAGAAIRYFDLEVEAGDLSGSAQERVYESSVEKQWAGGNISEVFSVNADIRGGNYTTDNSGEGSWMILSGGASYQRLFNYNTQVTADLNVVYASDEFDDRVYPGIDAEVTHWLQERLTLTGSLSTGPLFHTFEKLHKLNRFLTDSFQIRHTYEFEMAGEVRLEYLDGSTLFGRLSYMSSRDYAYFEKTDLPGSPSPGYFTVGYMDAERIKGSAGVTHQLVPEIFWINAEAYIQKPKLDNGVDIPYEERWGLNSGFSLQPVDRLVLEAWADYVGERKTVSSGELEGFLTLGGEVEIRITERIGVYARLLNLLNQDYEIWSGYPERPFQAYGGVTLKLN